MSRALPNEENAFKNFENPLDDSNNDEDVELGKGDNNNVDFTDSDDDDDVNLKFSRKIMTQPNKSMLASAKQSAMINHDNSSGGIPAVGSEPRDDMFDEDNMDVLRTLSLARPSIRNDALGEEDSHKGYLEKQSPSFLKHWQKRYFVLERKMLKYFKNEAEYNNGKPPKGVLNF